MGTQDWVSALGEYSYVKRPIMPLDVTPIRAMECDGPTRVLIVTTDQGRTVEGEVYVRYEGEQATKYSIKTDATTGQAIFDVDPGGRPCTISDIFIADQTAAVSVAVGCKP